jgi:hypothetical protein
MNQQKIVNLFSPLLEIVRYRNKKNPYLEFKKIRKDEILPSFTKGNVLVLPIRTAPVANLIEGVYSYAMRLRGYKIHGLFCKQFLSKCETIQHSSYNLINCSICNYEQNLFSDTFCVEKHTYAENLSVENINDIDKILSTTNVEKLFSLVYDEIFLGHHIKSAVLRYLMTNEVDFKSNERIIREFAYSTLSSYQSTKNLVQKIKPKFVLSSHGIYSTWGGALEACKSLNIPVIVWGRGYISGNLIVSYNESYAYECINESNSHWENIQLSELNKSKLKNYFYDKQNPNSKMDYINYYQGIDSLNKDFLSYLNIDKNKVVFGLFPNIPWDGTTFAATEGFPDMKIFIQSTIEWFSDNRDNILIIRAHPAERFNTNQETTKDLVLSICKNLPDNIIFINSEDNISSYDIANISDYCLVYASSISLELAYLNKPVIQTGVFNSSNKGFVFEAKNVEEYKILLNKASKKELIMTDDMKQRVEKYAYHWIYKRHIPENTYEHKALTFTKYNFNSSMELAPGKNKVVDWFIDRCEDGKPFIWND